MESKEQARKDRTQRQEAGPGEKAIDFLAAHHRQKPWTEADQISGSKRGPKAEGLGICFSLLGFNLFYMCLCIHKLIYTDICFKLYYFSFRFMELATSGRPRRVRDRNLFNQSSVSGSWK